MKDWKIFSALVIVFIMAYTLPLSNPKVTGAILEAFKLLQWYARNHTLACVVPALFIAGAIITFLSQGAVMKYLGPKANKFLAYGVASISGCILAVCSCSVLPMFAGIYALGAGLGPATAFLYSGPAINILALFLSARVLGLDLGLGRAVGAILFAVVIGLLMAFIFRRSEAEKAQAAAHIPEVEGPVRPLWKTGLYFLCMLLFLVFSDWFNPGNVILHTKKGEPVKAVILQEMKDQVKVQLEADFGGKKAGDKLIFAKEEIEKIEEAKNWVITIHHYRWYLAGLMGLLVLLMVWQWFTRAEIKEWMDNTWDFTKLLVPLLFGGVFVVGFIGALIPEDYVASLVGDNSLSSNLISSVIGIFFYFATLTEIPIVEALMKLGMAKGPALALLLAGPALSLPSMFVIWKIMGPKKTLVFCALVVVMATISGILFGLVV